MQLIYKLKYHICELEINIYHEYFQDKNIRIQHCKNETNK